MNAKQEATPRGRFGYDTAATTIPGTLQHLPCFSVKQGLGRRALIVPCLRCFVRGFALRSQFRVLYSLTLEHWILNVAFSSTFLLPG